MQWLTAMGGGRLCWKDEEWKAEVELLADSPCRAARVSSPWAGSRRRAPVPVPQGRRALLSAHGRVPGCLRSSETRQDQARQTAGAPEIRIGLDELPYLLPHLRNLDAALRRPGPSRARS